MIEVSSSETPSAEESSPGSYESQSSDLKDTPTADKDSESQKSGNDSESVKPQKSQNDSDMPVNNIEAKSISSESPYFSETKASEVETEMDSELVEISLRRIRPIFVDIPKKTLDLLPQIIDESMEKLKKVFTEYKEEEDEDVIEIVAAEKPEEPQRSPAQLTEVAPDTRSPDDIGLSDETYSPYSIEDGEHENGADSVKDDYPPAAPLVEVPFNDFALNLSKQLNPNSLVAVSINNNNNVVKKTLAGGHKTETSALQESSENKQNDKAETCQDVNKSIPMDQSENKSDSSSQQEKVGSTVDEVVDKSSMNGQAVAPSDNADGSSRRNIFEALEKLAPVFNRKGRDQILVKQEVVVPNDRFLPRVDQRVEQSTSLQKKAPITDGQVLAVSSHKNNQSKQKEVEATKKADKAVSFVVQKKIQATIKMEPEILQQQQSCNPTLVEKSSRPADEVVAQSINTIKQEIIFSRNNNAAKKRSRSRLSSSMNNSERPTRRSLRKTREVLIKEERDQVIMEKFNSPLLLKRLDAATKQIYKNKVKIMAGKRLDVEIQQKSLRKSSRRRAVQKKKNDFIFRHCKVTVEAKKHLETIAQYYKRIKRTRPGPASRTRGVGAASFGEGEIFTFTPKVSLKPFAIDKDEKNLYFK